MSSEPVIIRAAKKKDIPSVDQLWVETAQYHGVLDSRLAMRFDNMVMSDSAIVLRNNSITSLSESKPRQKYFSTIAGICIRSISLIGRSLANFNNTVRGG